MEGNGFEPFAVGFQSPIAGTTRPPPPPPPPPPQLWGTTGRRPLYGGLSHDHILRSCDIIRKPRLAQSCDTMTPAWSAKQFGAVIDRFQVECPSAAWDDVLISYAIL